MLERFELESILQKSSVWVKLHPNEHGSVLPKDRKEEEGEEEV